jgi:basic membrane protein A
MKKTALLLAFVMSIALFAGCAGSAPKAEESVSVAVVVAGGLGDRSFYDSANSGLDRLVEDYGVTPKVIECKEDASMFKTQLVNAAESSDFVVAVGWQFWDGLNEIAKDLPDTKFIYVDEAVEGFGNIYNIKYAQNEGSFLVGYIAGKMSKTGKVGAVGGMENDTINDFFVGYAQGAKYANPDITVENIYAGDFEDPAKGKECALTLYGKGCDIVFQVAGKTGEGVFVAAAETGNYAIGVDADQKYINPDVIICSMKKEVGNSIYDAVSKFIEDGTWNGGTTWIADMKTGFVDVGYGDDTMTQQVSDELKDEVEQIKQKIISGEIVVDTTRK